MKLNGGNEFFHVNEMFISSTETAGGMLLVDINYHGGYYRLRYKELSKNSSNDS